MKARITVITIGVDDLERSLRFYRDGLGLETQGIIGTEFEHGAVAFFDLQAGLKLAICPRESISHDSGLPPANPSPTEFTLGHNVSSEAEVDAVMKQAKGAGAVIVSQLTVPSGAVTPVISKIRIGIFGRSYGIPRW